MKIMGIESSCDETGVAIYDQETRAFEFRPGVVLPEGARLLALETTANMAVGPAVPWGLASVGLAPEPVREGEPLPASDVPYLVVGKDIHRRAWTRALVDAARAALARTPEQLQVLADAGVPRIHFGVGTGELLTDMAGAGTEVRR